MTRSTGLAKMTLQGTVQGGRRKDKQTNRCELSGWTELKLGGALRKTDDKEEGRKVVDYGMR